MWTASGLSCFACVVRLSNTDLQRHVVNEWRLDSRACMQLARVRVYNEQQICKMIQVNAKYDGTPHQQIQSYMVALIDMQHS